MSDLAGEVRRRAGADRSSDRALQSRTEKWDAHFLAAMGPLIPQGIAIQGLTPAGRATVQVLGLNDEMRQLIRYELLMEGLYIVATA